MSTQPSAKPCRAHFTFTSLQRTTCKKTLHKSSTDNSWVVFPQIKLMKEGDWPSFKLKKKEANQCINLNCWLLILQLVLKHSKSQLEQGTKVYQMTLSKELSFEDQKYKGKGWVIAWTVNTIWQNNWTYYSSKDICNQIPLASSQMPRHFKGSIEAFSSKWPDFQHTTFPKQCCCGNGDTCNCKM